MKQQIKKTIRNLFVISNDFSQLFSIKILIVTVNNSKGNLTKIYNFF